MSLNTLKLITITALGYWAFGQFASLFAIPPGFASPIWPAAGFAFLMVYRFGPKVVVGVFIASSILNVTIAQGDLWPLSMLWVTAVSIAIGSSLQTLVAHALTKRFNQSHDDIPSSISALYLGLIGGPVACVTSSTFAITSLWFSGVIPADAILKNWVNWWFGDSIGVMIFAPIILAVNLGRRHLVGRKQLVFFVFYFALACIATSIFLYAKQQEVSSNKRIFEEQAKGHFNTIRHRLISSALIANGMSAVFETFDDVNRQQFQAYAASLYKQVSGVQALSWIPIVKQSERLAMEVELLKLGGRFSYFYHLTDSNEEFSAPDKESYFPVYFIYPSNGNKSAIGFDLSSSPSRKKALDLSLATAESVATEPITLVQETGKQKAFLLFTPAKSKNGEIFGFVSTVYKMEDVIGAGFQAATLDDYVFAVDDVSDVTPKNLVLPEVEISDIYTFVDTISFGQRNWRVTISPSKAFALSYQSWWVWFILICAFFLITVLGLFLLLILSRTAEIEIEVNSKTIALKQALNKANNSSQVKSAFLASMSHELRTPLNSIIGFSARLQKKLKDQIDIRYLDYIGIIHKNGENLLVLINDLLDLSKVEAGKMTIDKSLFQVDAAVNEVLTSLSHAAENKQISLCSSPSPMSELFADRLRFIQMLTNLVSNAVKFSSSGTVHVRFNIKAIAHQVGLELEVKDSGKGIASEDIPKLFRRYEQLGDTFQGGEIGTGLGLALVQELVHLHGGKVYVTSKFGHGSSFFIWLPASTT